MESRAVAISVHARLLSSSRGIRCAGMGTDLSRSCTLVSVNSRSRRRVRTLEGPGIAGQ